MLLLYRKGCESFEDLRTVNGIVLSSFREACRALGFLETDQDCVITLNEAANFATSPQLRELFVMLLLNCTPDDPGMLWDKYKRHMIDDILNDVRKINPVV